MRKSILTMLLCLIATFAVKSQDLKPVADVDATENNNAIDLIWSWNEIVPDIMYVDFETGDLSQADFKNDQTAPWAITEDAYQGSYAIKSTCEGIQGGVSAIEITVDVPYDATMSFYHKVDCEYYFDNAYFFIDGVERALITGDVDWEYKEFKVKKGVHTYRWTYKKDNDDYGISTDAYFIDNIVLFKKQEPFNGGWIYYDDGHYVNAVGSDTGTLNWGISYQDTEKYAGYNLTKVSLYSKNAAKIRANIYYGGEDAPSTMVTSEEFQMKGTGQFEEFQLSTPIPIDGTEPLWITFFSADPTYVGAACNYTGDEDSDWVSFDNGETWGHMIKEFKLEYTWMVRGYLENDRGEVITLNNNTRDFKDYKIYRKNNFTESVELLAENVTDTVYTDNDWSELDFGYYQWGVAAVYDENDAEIAWSNAVDKDMFTTVNVNVSTNSDDSPQGIKVKFANVNETDYYYKANLDETGAYTFDKFRKGTYNYSISLDGFETYAQENVEIIDATNISCVLNEIKAAVENLYVSPTGWAMWEDKEFSNGGGSFFFDFEDGLLDGWTTIDADGDGFNWRLTTEIMGPGYGHNKSRYCVISQSYDLDSIGALTPDNYLITTEKYLITEDSQLSYYVCAQDVTAPAEHYAVALSTDSNTDINDFVTVWEETLSRSSKSTRNSRAQGAWYKRTIDLREYAGQEVYIAFRHFHSVGQFYIDIDDICLVNNAKSARSLKDYTVKLNGEIVAENVTEHQYQHQLDNLVEGKTYTTSVIANYASGESEAAEYNWTYISSDNYAGAVELEGREVAGKAYLEWLLQGDETPAEAEDNFFFDFNDGTLDGWRNIDADGDGYVWYNSAEMVGPGYGYKDSLYCIVSHSFFSGQFNFSLTPDNYLVTEKKYAITEDSKLSFVVCAQDPSWYEEHYGVAISLIDNPTADDFVTIWEETLESDDTDYQTPQTPWVTKTIDLSQYAGEEVYIALRHFNCTDQYMLDIDNVALTSGSKSATNENEVLGVMVYCEGELLTKEPITNRSYVAEFPGDEEYEYCVRVVYDNYAMSVPQCVTIDAPMSCVAPKDLYGEVVVSDDGKTGVSLSWPYKLPPTSAWLYYDNDSPKSAMGMNGNPFYWAIMFPAEKLQDYAGTSITKIKTFDALACDASVLVCYGSATQPGGVVSSENFLYSGANDWIEIELSQPVPVTGVDNIWVMIYQVGAQYPAVFSDDIYDDPNGRWISTDGMQWFDLKSFDSSYKYTWVLKAFVTNEDEAAKELKEIDFHGEISDVFDINISEEPIVMSSRSAELDHYKIYRGNSLDDMTVIEETTENTYFDEVPAEGLYYYQVTSVYKDGDETCESEPANSYKNPHQNYVMVEILSLDNNGVKGMMIYPNPTKDNLTINAETMTRITVMNTLGQIVYDRDVNTDNEVIDMSQYEAGVYMVRIATENGVATRRVTVVR